MKIIDAGFLERTTKVYGLECKKNLVIIAESSPSDTDEEELLAQAVEITYQAQFRGSDAIGKLRFPNSSQW